MLGAARVIAFVPSLDPTRSGAFYADVLGLNLEEVTPYACVLRGGSVMVRVTKVGSLQLQPFTALGWQVDDIHTVAARLAGAGVDLVSLRGHGPRQRRGVDDAGGRSACLVQRSGRQHLVADPVRLSLTSTDQVDDPP
jgi:catechol 2,3-dioxygenase-like lactoylglutathione lyase family enzyme